MRRLGFMAITQYGETINIKKHPRKELMAHFGTSHAAKMYVDDAEGKAMHTGYVVGGQWCTIYAVHSWK